MKRIVPDEINRLQGWLLSRKEFDDANFIGDVKKAMENGEKLTFAQSFKFERLLKQFKFKLMLEGKI